MARGEAAAVGLCAEGIDARAVKLNVVDAADIAAAAAFVQSEFGALDILINNAGILSWEAGPNPGDCFHLANALPWQGLFPVRIASCQ